MEGIAAAANHHTRHAGNTDTLPQSQCAFAAQHRGVIDMALPGHKRHCRDAHPILCHGTEETEYGACFHLVSSPLLEPTRQLCQGTAFAFTCVAGVPCEFDRVSRDCVLVCFTGMAQETGVESLPTRPIGHLSVVVMRVNSSSASARLGRLFSHHLKPY